MMTDAQIQEIVNRHAPSQGEPWPMGAMLREAFELGAGEYHKVMAWLQDTQIGHGLCRPRERRACTHCNAVDDLAAYLKTYRGPRVTLSDPPTAGESK